MYYGDHMNAGGWVLMIFGMVILLVVLVALVWWVVSQQRSTNSAGGVPMSPREKLDHRLIDGEITGEQYDGLRSKLDAPAPPVPL